MGAIGLLKNEDFLVTGIEALQQGIAVESDKPIKPSLALAKALPFGNRAIDRATYMLKSINVVRNSHEQDLLLRQIANVAKPTIVSFINAHAFNIAWNDEAFADSLRGSDIILRDGIGISLVMKALGMTAGLNMNGTDLIPLIAERFIGKRVAICGTQDPYLTVAAEKLQAMGCKIVLIMDGFLSPEMYAEHVKASYPDLVILAMGMPKQEAVSMLLAASLDKPAVIVNGGAILDFLASRFQRAPHIWQLLRIEWLFRLCNEPRRLWRRYLLGGGILLGRMARLRLSGQFK